MSIKITQGTTKREWLKLAGALVETSLKALKRARDLAQIATSIMNVAIRDGLPAHESALSWRTAEAQQRNAEESLFGLVDSLSRAGYPTELFSIKSDGGWQPGPVRIPEFNKGDTFSRFLTRMNNVTGGGWMASEKVFARFGLSQAESMLTRLALEDAMFTGHVMTGVTFYGSNFDRAALIGCTFDGANFSCTSMRSAILHFTRLSEIQFDSIDITGADLSDCFYLEERGGKIQTIKITAKFIEKKIASERAANRRVNAAARINTVAGDESKFAL